VGTNASKIMFSIHRWAYALKKYMYKRCPRHIKSLAYLSSGPIGPAIMHNDIGQTPEKLDPRLWHPHYMRLHGRWEILDLGHGYCASERSEVALHSSQNSLSLSGWRSPCNCWSIGCCWSCLWSRTSSSPREVCWVHWSHICT
jgi:hypothetical protein